MTPKLVLLAITLSAGATAAPVAAQMRAISFAPAGSPMMAGQPVALPFVPQAVTITTVQTTEEDEDGNPISTSVETRIEPMTAFAYTPLGVQASYLPASAPQPMPTPEIDPATLPGLVTPDAATDADMPGDAASLPIRQTVLDIPPPDFDAGPPPAMPPLVPPPARGPVQTAQAGDEDGFSVPAFLRTPAPLPIQAAQQISQAMPVRNFGTFAPAVLSRQAAGPRALSIHRDPRTGHFIAPIRINGVVIQAIVDTGAQDTILSQQDARATGANRDIVRSEPMAGIGGYTMLNVARLRSMEVAGQDLGSFTAAIGQEGIPYTLLGQTEINRLGRIVIEDGVMTITAHVAQVALR